MSAAAAASAESTAPAAPFLKMSGLRKTYPGVVALADLSLDVRPGEIIGVVGENGAGKSTLMKILGGVIQPDRGSIEIDGTQYAGLSVGGSMQAGIAFVHQELNLFDNLDVAANIYIGREPTTGGFLKLVDNAKLHAIVKPYLDLLGANFDPSTQVSALSLAQQQMVEIAKALSLNSRLVILDEPTSSLPIAETEKVLEVMRRLRDRGITVFFISHRLNEVVAVCDRVVVLRDGKMVGTLEKGQINHDSMVKLMVGRDLRVAYTPPKAQKGDVVLAARDVRTSTYPAHRVSLELHSGEILGLAGLVGAGRTELARAFFGIDRTQGGQIILDGQVVPLAHSADAVKAGIFLVPEDRKGNGILLDLPIYENVSLPNLSAYSTGSMVSSDAEKKQAEQSKRELDIRTPTVNVRTGSLSGGNQQKVVLAKWLAMKPKVMIFDEPTRGIDIGAKSEIYRLMRALADNGVAVLMISSDMEEVIGVSDRVAVMHEGRISGVLNRDQFSEENILHLAVGKSL
jgi:ribose transport system ATP-binding protein